MVSVLDVAEHAGVSSATVSRVLGGRVPVSAETKLRVLKSVERLGYHPNTMARGLRSGRGRAVALVTGDIEQGAYAALAKHLQAAIEAIGLDLLLFNLGHREERLRQLLVTAPSLGLRAVLLATPHVMEMNELMPLIRAASGAGVTVISLSQDLVSSGIASILHDDAGGAELAVTHLLAQGRGPIAFLGRVETSAVGRERFNGYARALTHAGQVPDPALVWDILHGYRADAGYQAVSRAIDAGHQFGAVFAASDELALGAIAAAQDRGLTVPADMAVIGFGGLEWGRFTRPSLTTVALDVAAVGVAVGEEFQALSEGTAPVRRRAFMPRLILRASV